MTKKQIYKSAGIEFDGEKLLSPFGWIKPPLIDGNSKIGRGVWHFSTLATNKQFNLVIDGKEISLLGTCPCHCTGCYATKGNYNFSSTKVSLAIRTILARDFMDWLEKAINAQIKAEKIKFVRIHASGDFFSRDYAEMWKRIAIENPSVKMWTYTKNTDCENIFDGLENANVVKSIIPHKGVNYGHCDYILSMFEYLREAGKKVYICRCGIDKNQHCTNCKSCSENDYVLFIEHSTEYKAEKDPLFPVLKAVIEAQ